MPYHVRRMESYNLDHILAEIDMQKTMQPKGVLGPTSIFAKVGSGLGRIMPYMGLIVAGVVVAWAVIAG